MQRFINRLSSRILVTPKVAMSKLKRIEVCFYTQCRLRSMDQVHVTRHLWINHRYLTKLWDIYVNQWLGVLFTLIYTTYEQTKPTNWMGRSHMFCMVPCHLHISGPCWLVYILKTYLFRNCSSDIWDFQVKWTDLLAIKMLETRMSKVLYESLSSVSIIEIKSYTNNLFYDGGQ